jgi:hypothetical protein
MTTHTIIFVLEDSPAHGLIKREFEDKEINTGTAIAVSKEELESWRKDTEIVNLILRPKPPEPSGPNWWPPGWLPIGR